MYIGKVCGKKMSYFLGVIAPWLVSFVFLQGTYFSALINWSSLVVNGVVNFLIPLILYYKAITVTGYRVDDKGTEYISGLSFEPSTVEPYPAIMRKNAKLWTIIFFIVTTILVVAQIIYALILIAHGKQPFQ